MANELEMGEAPKAPFNIPENNHVGVQLDDADKEPKVIRTEAERLVLFGEFLGFVTAGNYAAEDSICLKQPMSYTVIADCADTFVLSISRVQMNSSFPDTVLEKMTKDCLLR